MVGLKNLKRLKVKELKQEKRKNKEMVATEKTALVCEKKGDQLQTHCKLLSTDLIIFFNMIYAQINKICNFAPKNITHKHKIFWSQITIAYTGM